MTMNEMMQKVENKVAEDINKANQVLRTQGKLGVAFPQLIFRNLGGTAGYAHGTYKLEFNMQIAQNNWDEFFPSTVTHEVAHLMAHRMGAHGHDKIWKWCMVQLGAVPERCHQMEVPGRYIYKCQCGQTYNMSETIHGRFQRGHGGKCTKCHTVPKWTGRIGGQVQVNKVVEQKAAERPTPAPKMAAPETRYVYKCRVCGKELELSKRMHNNMALRGKKYTHSGDNGNLDYVGTRQVQMDFGVDIGL